MSHEMVHVAEGVELAAFEKQSPELVRLATFVMRGISSKAICESFGFSESRLSQIKEEPLFQQVYQAVVKSAAEALVNTDSAWDRLEAKALSTLESVLKFSRDPKLALNVAVQANRAERRTRPGNKTLDPSGGVGGRRAVITLSQRIVEKLNETQVGKAGGVRTVAGERATTNTVTVEELNQAFKGSDDLDTAPLLTDMLGPSRD